MMDRNAVEQVLARRVRPMLARHGGDLRLVETGEDGSVTLELLGACAGCPSADLSMKGLVEKILREEFPELRRVELFQPVPEDLLAQARALLRSGRA